MPSQKVIDYVQDALKKGFSKEQISEKLKDAGYSDKQIEEAIGNKLDITPEELTKNLAVDKATTFSNKNKLKANIIIWIFLVIMVIIIIGILIFGQSINLTQVTEIPANDGETMASWQYPEEYSMTEYRFFEIKDLSTCGGGSVEELRSCMKNLPSWEINTLTDCDTLSETEIRLLCTAIIRGDKESCSVTYNPEFCYSLQVRNRDDLSGCSIIDDELYRNNCISSTEQEERIAQYNQYIFVFEE